MPCTSPDRAALVSFGTRLAQDMPAGKGLYCAISRGFLAE
jgi:hypothetical protein